MVLYWSIEAIEGFLIAFVGIIAVAFTYRIPKIKKIRSLFFIRLSILGLSVFALCDSIGYVFNIQFFSLLAGISFFPTILFMIIGINYTIRESIYSLGLLIACGFGFLLIYSAFLPDAIVPEYYMGSLRLDWQGLFGATTAIFQAIGSIYMLYWGIKTWKNVPFLIRREALLFLIGIIMASIVTLIFYILYLFDNFFILLANLSVMIGILIFTYAAIKEPKLLYILPFKVHRIIVKDRDGDPLYDHSWSETIISENIFTGFINAVQLMSEEVMDIGGLLDINLQQGILILQESKDITVGLVASKTSRLLRESVINFTKEFESKFERQLKKSLKNMSDYENAYELIDKYFSNFPYRIIKSKKHPLLLGVKFSNIPQELENKLRSAFPDKIEFDMIRSELIKSPLCVSEEFLELYDDLKKEEAQIAMEEQKLLDKKKVDIKE